GWGRIGFGPTKGPFVIGRGRGSRCVPRISFPVNNPGYRGPKCLIARIARGYPSTVHRKGFPLPLFSGDIGLGPRWRRWDFGSHGPCPRPIPQGRLVFGTSGPSVQPLSLP